MEHGDPKALAGMQPKWRYGSPQEGSALPTSANAPASLTVATLANMTYRFGEGKSATTVKLVDSKGRDEGEQFLLDRDHVAFGDLDGDGVDDAVVVLVSSGGGSGVFYSLVAVMQRNGRLETPAVRSLGDRIKINEINIRNDIVTVDMITQGPNDPLCCPTERQMLKLAVRGNKFMPVE